MKPIVIVQVLQICIATISVLIIPQLAQSQIPPIIDTTAPVTPRETSASTNTAAISKLEVRCQDLKTVVRKGDQKAIMMTWNTNYFGRDFSNKKRCQVVSERLQKAANLNGGTFKGLELASGTVNFQPVICALKNGLKKCDRDNMLFTLKPENANNPEAVIEQIFDFAENGSGSVNESVQSQPKANLNLGNWEWKTFNRSPRGGKKGF